jgi:hypothetical protein
MLKNMVVAVLLLIGLLASPAFADKCKDPIVDEVNALSADDRSGIEAAVNKLVLRGADVRVQVLSSFHNTHSVDEYKAMFQAKCKSWQSPDGGFKNNAIVVLVVPKKKATGLYYGEQWRRSLEEGKTSVFTDMNGRFRDGKIGEGIVVGLDDVDGLLSVKVADAGKPVVIDNRKPTDFSGFWKVLGWIVTLGALGVLVFAGLWFYRQREERRGAQRDARTERAKCSQALNGYTTSLAVLKAKIAGATLSGEWKSRLNELFNQVEQTYARASAAFNALSRSANDPETPGLSVQEYQAMQERYRGVAGQFEQADDARDKLDRQFKRAQSGEPFPGSKPVEEPVRPAAAERETVSPSPVRNAQAVPPPVQETRPGQVTPPQASGSSGQAYQPQYRGGQHHDHRHEGDTTVVVVNAETVNPVPYPYGDSWAHDRHREPDRPVIVEPPEPDVYTRPSQGGDISGDWGKTGQGDGVSGDWGKSGSGDRVSGSWTEPVVAVRDEPATPTSWDSSPGTTY